MCVAAVRAGEEQAGKAGQFVGREIRSVYDVDEFSRIVDAEMAQQLLRPGDRLSNSVDFIDGQEQRLPGQRESAAGVVQQVSPAAGNQLPALFIDH